MYKVFVNEKELFLSKYPKEYEKVINFENLDSLEMGIDLLLNTSCKNVNIYHENIDQLWKEFSKLFFRIEAAGGIVKNDEDRILFIKRLGRWDLPKGKIERGESIESAATREVSEETGISELKIIEFLTQTYHVYIDRNLQKILKITHWFSMLNTGNQLAIPQAEEGITAVSWKNKVEIQEEVYPSTFQNIKLILKEFS